MRSIRTPSSALRFGLCLGALLLVRYPEAHAQDVKPPPAKEEAAKKADTAAGKDAAKKPDRPTQKSDADLAARKPPPATESLDPRRAKFKRVKTGETGVGQSHDESDKLAAPTAPPESAPVATTAPENESDEKLRERVQTALLTDRKLPYTARLVSVAVKKGTITLSGEVNTDYERMRVTQVVDGMRGRHDVINRISVRNRSPEAVQATRR